MSQSGDLNPVSSNPQIPTSFITDDGDAIPIANELEILGAVVANAGVPVETVGSGNTVTINVQVADAVAATDLSAVGLAAFDSADFSVDANGFVSLVGGGSGITTINGDSGSITGAVVTIYANNAASNAGGTVEFVNAGTTSTLNITDPTLFNTMIGLTSGNLTVTGTHNTSLGYESLRSVTTGTLNVALGYRSQYLCTQGASNIAVGNSALFSNTIGSFNVCVGETTLSNLIGNWNTAVGHSALQSYNGDANTAVGYFAARLASGAGLTSIGFLSLSNNSTGARNTAVGYWGLASVTTGTDNTVIGYDAGKTYNGAESNNICIGANVTGTLGESNVTRIGSGQTQAYLAGVLNTNSGRVIKVTTPGAYPYTTLTTDHLILVDTSAARTINLIAAPVTGTLYYIKDSVGSAAANNITITPAAGNIDGAASKTIASNYGSMTIVYNGTEWSIV